MQIPIYDFIQHISKAPITLKIRIYRFILGPLYHLPVSIPIAEASKAMGFVFPLCCSFIPAFIHKCHKQYYNLTVTLTHFHCVFAMLS